MRKSFVRSIAVAALALAGCSSGGSPTLGGSATPSPRPSTTGDLTIVTPATGAVYAPGDPIPVQLQLSGAVILEEATTTVDPGEGHVHLKLDGTVLTLLAGLEMDLTELVEEPIEPGTHLLEVEFVAGDHGAFSPREIETITFTIRG